MNQLSFSEDLSSYHPIEHFYFRTYLNRQAQLPLGIDEEELYDCRSEKNEESSPPYLHLNRGFSNDLDASINNAVARLMLEPIADRLPNFIAVNRKDGSIRSSRPPASSAYKSRGVTGLPNFLFKINWATSGPGFSWEESYHVAFLAEYDVYIVTASQDSDDALGFCDVCIGYFENSQDVIYDALSEVKDWWSGKVGEYDADKYESLTSVGSASVDQIDFITAEVWNSERTN